MRSLEKVPEGPQAPWKALKGSERRPQAENKRLYAFMAFTGFPQTKNKGLALKAFKVLPQATNKGFENLSKAFEGIPQAKDRGFQST